MKAIVIDDEATSRLVLKRLLSRFFPHAVIEAENGEEALELMAKEPPVIIFTDLQMPGMGGVAMIRAIRANPDLAHIPVVAISSANERDIVTEVVGLGVTDYLVKPLELESTFRRLERIVQPAIASFRKRVAQGARRAAPPEPAAAPHETPAIETEAPSSPSETSAARSDTGVRISS
jgi:two-component system chemotaxis response regulator CheY